MVDTTIGAQENYTKRTSTSDLYKLCKELGLTNVHVCRQSDLKQTLSNKRIRNIIINLDDYGGGSHWVAINTPKKMYFDSYAQYPPLSVPKVYKMASQKKEIQSIEATDCGALCALWLYYINYKSNPDYYQLFRDCYK